MGCGTRKFPRVWEPYRTYTMGCRLSNNVLIILHNAGLVGLSRRMIINPCRRSHRPTILQSYVCIVGHRAAHLNDIKLLPEPPHPCSFCGLCQAKIAVQTQRVSQFFRNNRPSSASAKPSASLKGRVHCIARTTHYSLLLTLGQGHGPSMKLASISSFFAPCTFA